MRIAWIDPSHAKGWAAIGNVALELGLDRSNASRMLAAAVGPFVLVRINEDGTSMSRENLDCRGARDRA